MSAYSLEDSDSSTTTFIQLWVKRLFTSRVDIVSIAPVVFFCALYLSHVLRRIWPSNPAPLMTFDPVFRCRSRDLARAAYVYRNILLFLLACASPGLLLLFLRYVVRLRFTDLTSQLLINTAHIAVMTIFPFVAFYSVSGLSHFITTILSVAMIVRPPDSDAVDTLRAIEQRQPRLNSLLERFGELVLSSLFPVLCFHAIPSILDDPSSPARFYASPFQILSNAPFADEFNESKTPRWVWNFHRRFEVDDADLVYTTPYAEAHPWLSTMWVHQCHYLCEVDTKVGGSVTSDLFAKPYASPNSFYHLALWLVVIAVPWHLPGSRMQTTRSKLQRGLCAITPLVLKKAVVLEVWFAHELLVLFIALLPIATYEYLAAERYRLGTLLGTAWSIVGSFIRGAERPKGLAMLRPSVVILTLAFVAYQLGASVFDLFTNKTLCLHRCVSVGVCRTRLASVATLAILYVGNMQAVVFGKDSWYSQNNDPLWCLMAAAKKGDRIPCSCENCEGKASW